MGEWLEPYRDADDEMLRKFRAKGIELHKNGISLKLVPRFQGFMVDYMVAERSESAIFWHGVKNPEVLQKHWKVQEDNTTYPKCQPIENFKVIFKTTTPYVKKTESTKSNNNQTTGDLVQELKEDLSHLGKGTIQPGLRLVPSGNFFLALNRSHNFLLKKSEFNKAT